MRNKKRVTYIVICNEVSTLMASFFIVKVLSNAYRVVISWNTLIIFCHNYGTFGPLDCYSKQQFKGFKFKSPLLEINFTTNFHSSTYDIIKISCICCKIFCMRKKKEKKKEKNFSQNASILLLRKWSEKIFTYFQTSFHLQCIFPSHKTYQTLYITQ